jgi:energy-coupling factor transporter ATP-binding protein EcfA2
VSAADGADIVFLLGLSGAGKTTLASWLAEDLGLLHHEIDRPDEDGIDREGFRPEWDAFLGNGEPADLARVIRGRAAAARRHGTVLSFSSELVLDVAAIHAAEAAGIRSFVLHGTREECLAAFLERERATGRGLTRDYWARYNDDSYIQYGRAEFAPYRLGTFAGGRRRTRSDLVAEVRNRLAG